MSGLQVSMALDFEAILGRLEVAVLVHEAGGAILYANGAACDLLGIEQEALLKLSSFDTAWDLVNEADQPLTPEQQPNVVATRTKVPVRDAVIGVRRGNERVWIEVSAEPSHL